MSKHHEKYKFVNHIWLFESEEIDMQQVKKKKSLCFYTIFYLIFGGKSPFRRVFWEDGVERVEVWGRIRSPSQDEDRLFAR